MRERRAVVLGPDTAVLVERRLQSLVAEGWVPMGALSCAACEEGVVIVGVFERSPVAGEAPAVPPARAEAPAPPPSPPRAEDAAGPPCHLCGGRMVRRMRKADGKPFWGCASFPECRGIINWQDWTPPEARRAESPSVPPAQAALPGFAPAGEAAACWGPAAEPPKEAPGTWMGDSDDNVPF
jgi:hypothetical protein